ncbi:MAG: phage tail protein [Burkholderiales bacterium RIFCSPHIGHO2_01_FULL_63_240]|jgi:microcystin-dependent protein|nr:MAG: phage tail protein [Burkholderiales bacterium RIFCSPHIGHO2_01_FULL_63_240]
MPTPFVGEIRLFAGNFAPSGWALCDGSMLSIAENETLFNLIGTTYGGDGQSTFALPDLRGRVPIHHGQGPGLSNRVIGEAGGVEQVTLTAAQMPAHAHAMRASSAAASGNAGVAGSLLATPASTRLYGTTPGGAGSSMSPAALSASGGSQAHENRAPSLGLSCIISLFGVFPSQG